MQALELRLEAARAGGPISVSGGPFRLIHGGRSDEPTPGLLIVGAAEVVTLAGGVRMGEAQGDVGRLSAADVGGPGRAGRAGRRLLGGPDRRGRAHGRRWRPRSRRRATRSAGSPGSTPAAGPSPRGSSIRTPTCCSPARARASGSSASVARAISRSSPPAAGSCRRSPRPAPPRPDELMAHGRRWLDEMLGHGVTTIEAKSGYGLDLETEIRLIEAAYRLGEEGPIDVVPTYLGAHAVPPEFRARPDGTEAYVRSIIEEQLPGVAAHGRARFCDVFCEGGVFDAGPVAADPRGGRRLRAADSGSTPTSWPRRAAPSWRPSSGPRRRTTSRRHPRPGSTRSPLAAAGGSRGRGDGPAGDDLVPHEGPRRAGPDVHRARHPGRDRHGLQPGHVTDGQPAAGHDRRLPRARPDPGRGAQRGHDQRRPGARPGGRDRVARAGQERRPRGLARADLRPRSRTGRPPT